MRSPLWVPLRVSPKSEIFLPITLRSSVDTGRRYGGALFDVVIDQPARLATDLLIHLRHHPRDLDDARCDVIGTGVWLRN